MTDDSLRRAIAFQVEAMSGLEAPFGAEFLRRTAEDLSGPVGRLLDPWRDAEVRAVLGDAAPLRLLASFNHLAASGDEPELARLYPAASPQTEWPRLWPALEAAARRHGARLADFMRHEPQTNEVRRSICLLGGFLTIAEETGLPLRCFELGASAGLNMNWDRFGYRLGSARWGEPASAVQLDADWEGGLPPIDASIRILERRGCDRRPTDLANPKERARLEAYVWPDQPARLQRLHRAADLALAAGAKVEEADAAEWLEHAVRLQAKAATVVYHSVFWQYPPEASRHRMRSAIEALAKASSDLAPFFWLRMEPSVSRPSGPMEVLLTAWPRGDERRLAAVHPHGAFVRWVGGRGAE